MGIIEIETTNYCENISSCVEQKHDILHALYL